MQDAIQRAKQAVSVRVRVKNRKNNPVMIAPTTLVVTKVKPKRIADRSMVPNMAIRSLDRELHTQLSSQVKFVRADTKSTMGRYTTPIPKLTQKKAVPTVKTPVILRNAVIIPITNATAKDRA